MDLGRLHSLLHDAAWDALVAKVPARYRTVRGYLDTARPHAFTFLDDALQRRLAHLGGVDLGTGVIERLMRELNARTDTAAAARASPDSGPRHSQDRPRCSITPPGNN